MEIRHWDPPGPPKTFSQSLEIRRASGIRRLDDQTAKASKQSSNHQSTNKNLTLNNVKNKTNK